MYSALACHRLLMRFPIWALVSTLAVVKIKMVADPGMEDSSVSKDGLIIRRS